MNQPPDPYQQYPQYPQPGVYDPNSVPPTVAAPQPPPPYGDGTPYGQPGGNPYAPDYNQPGYYPPPAYPPQPPTSYSPQSFPASYPPPPEPGQWSGPPPQTGPQRPGKTGWIIGGISAIVVIAILTVALIATHGFTTSPFTAAGPQQPPSKWVATQQSGSSNYKYAYFIQWTNQNGQLTGTMDASDGLQSLTFTFTGTYDYQNHTVTLHLDANTEIGSSAATLTGTIENNNTMTLHDASTTTTTDDPTFHSASRQDYDNAKQNLNNPSY